ncbi:MAG: hypothetical protein HY360_06155 [Verrucomicrobia bacterium]|nr:hypothetical protein [Verrucomicrobiota bacterium]
MQTLFHNPYWGKPGHWIRVNFHGHCQESSPCSSVPLEQGVRMYHDVGARCIAVTDHDVITNLDQMRMQYRDMIFLEGFEHSRSKDVLFIGEAVGPLLRLPLNEAVASADDALTIICHPQPRKDKEFWSKEKIASMEKRPDGIEIYNGHYGVERLLASGHTPQYTRLWDMLLTEGIVLWGFANDDFHDLADFNNAFNMVLVKHVTAQDIVRAAKGGCCYASTGLLMESLSEEQGSIQIATKTTCEGRFIGPHGKTLSASAGMRFEYQPTIEAYVRFEATGESGSLFLQPMFRGHRS